MQSSTLLYDLKLMVSREQGMLARITFYNACWWEALRKTSRLTPTTSIWTARNRARTGECCREPSPSPLLWQICYRQIKVVQPMLLRFVKTLKRFKCQKTHKRWVLIWMSPPLQQKRPGAPWHCHDLLKTWGDSKIHPLRSKSKLLLDWNSSAHQNPGWRPKHLCQQKPWASQQNTHQSRSS